MAPVIIALDADMSAVAVEAGQAIERGARIAIDEINAAGGILGRSLVLQVFDHRGNPARGKKNIERIAQLPNVLAVLGGAHTPVTLEELPLLHQHQLIYLGPWAAGTGMVNNGYSPNYVFRVSVQDTEAAKMLLQHAAQRGFTQVAVILERTGWGRSSYAALQQLAPEYGITLSNINWINWRQNEYLAPIEEIVNSKAQAIIVVVNAPEGVLITKTLERNNLAIPLISHSGLAAGDFAAQLGKQRLAKLDLTVLQSFNFVNVKSPDIAKKVVTAYRAAFDANATPATIQSVPGVANAYDLIHMVALAAQQADSIEREKVRDALERLPEYHGLVKDYQPPFAPTQHDALFAEDYFMATFNDLGQLVPYEGR